MKLIIAEKPSVARDIAAVLGSVTRKEGYMEAGGYTVTYALGHLVGLADADAYNPNFKQWNMEHLPILPNPFQLQVLSSSKTQYNVINKLLKQASEVIVATDAGREGQLIYEFIAQKSNYTGPAKRLWLSSMTEEAIREAFKHLRDNNFYKNLAAAAMSRSEADWIVGINATRAITLKGKAKLSLGRVQTPTLAMIVERDHAIANFKPTPYCEVQAHFLHANGEYQGKWFREKETRFATRQQAEAIVAKIQGQPATILSVEQVPKTEAQPQLFDLTSLQRKANQLYGFSAKKTLDLAQALYETHKVLTYPRTDSRYISGDIVPTLPPRMKAAASLFPDLVQHLSSANPYPPKRVVDDSKVSDHHAIIPTDKKPGTLTEDERKIYELVARYTLAALLPPAKWESTTIITEVAAEQFKTLGRVLIHAGWRVAIQEPKQQEDENEEAEYEATLPAVTQGDAVRLKSAEALSKQTKPPAYYNEASLLLAMEQAGKSIEDEELAEAMKERGLGTPATRASIIEKLKRDNYIEMKGKQIRASDTGKALIAAVTIPVLKSPELTGEWESKLKQMEQGKYERQQFIGEIETFVRTIIGEIQKVSISVPPAQVQTLGECPKCHSPIKEGTKAYGCTGWKKGCDFKIWKEISGHKMTVAQVNELLTKGTTKKLKFKSKAGKDFDAKLKLKTDGTIEFDFVQSTPRKGKKTFSLPKR